MIKTSRPIVKGVIPRPRLFKQLDLLWTRPVIWISAPAGSGKTTLVSSYIEERRIPCLWYQLDRSDGDLATFFHYLGEATKMTTPKRRKPLPALSPEYLHDIPTFTLRFFEQVYGRLNPPFSLVFDNYQEVPADSQLHEEMSSALSLVPEGIHAVVISRMDPPPHLIRLQANRQIGLLEWPEIRLTKEETKNIIVNRSQGFNSETIVDRLHEWSDGWAAGLVLMTEMIRREKSELRPIGDRSFEAVFDYFAKEVFETLDRQTQEFLLKSALLPRMTVRMAEEMTNTPSAGEILKTMRRSNAFISKHLDTESVYEFHPLFRNFLISWARKNFASEDMNLHQGRAAKLLKKSNMVEEAMVLLREVHAWDEMAEIILAQAPEMLKHGRHHLMQEWLGALPDEMIQSNPWLHYWRGMSILSFTPGAARLCFEAAFTQLHAHGDLLGAILAASGAVNAIAYELEDFTRIDHWFPLLNDLIKEIPSFPNAEIEAWVTASMITALSIREISHPDAPSWIERALHLKETPETINPKIHALFQLFWYQGVNRGMNGLSPLLQILQRLARSSTAQPFSQLLVRIAESQFNEEVCLHQECLDAVDKALEFSQKHGIHCYGPAFHCMAIASCLNRLDIKKAQDRLNILRPNLENSGPWSGAAMYHQFAREALIRNDLQQADYYAQRAFAMGDPLGSPFITGCSHWMLAQVCHRLGKTPKAREHLKYCFSIVEQHGTRWVETMAYLYDAQFAFDRGDHHQGLISLEKSLAIAREHGYFLTCLDDTRVTLRMCEKALEAGIETEHVQQIIRKRRLVPEKPPFHIPSWPWAIRIFTLRPFSLEKDGEPIPSPKKTQQMPLRLLKALITLGGTDVPQDRLTALLWPDADGDTAHHACETTLFRLRKLVGYAEALLVRDGKVSLNPRFAWVDAWAFERLVAEAEAKMQQNHAQTAMGQLETALALYQADFLSGDRQEPWMIPSAERLTRKWRRAILCAGDLLEASGQTDQARLRYEQWLDQDESNEDLYCRLMTHCLRRGRSNEALALYNRCHRALAAIGAAPSPDVEALCRAIRSA